jgi:hypothetical protein
MGPQQVVVGSVSATARSHLAVLGSPSQQRPCPETPSRMGGVVELGTRLYMVLKEVNVV